MAIRKFGFGYFGRGIKREHKWLAYANGYKDSVKMLLKEIQNNPRYQHHAYQILPLLYLFHMYVELQLKGLIIYKNGKIGKDHSLYNYLNLLKSIDSSVRLSRRSEKFIKELDVLSKKSQAFRYPEDTNQKDFFQIISHDLRKILYDINDFQKLEEIFNFVLHDLENIEGDFEYARDSRKIV